MRQQAPIKQRMLLNNGLKGIRDREAMCYADYGVPIDQFVERDTKYVLWYVSLAS
jgi:hypothetical protein